MTTTPPPIEPTGDPSYLRLTLRLLGILAMLGGIAWTTLRPRPQPTPVVSIPAIPEAKPVKPAPVIPAAPRPIEPDRAAIARAEAAVDAAARARGLAESRLADAEIALKKATLDAANQAAASRALGSRVKDPTARLERAANRATLAKWEVKKLQTEIKSLEKVPRSKSKNLVDQSAVAKPVDGKEFHFEVRRDRVAFIDIERLSALVKVDVRLRMKLAVTGQAITGTVGPIGDFSMRYEMGPSISGALADLLDARQVSYQLQGWEIVPEHESRGVPYDRAWQPGSDFARVIQTLNPQHAAITLWIYPDGFPLYRRLRDDLHARGFLVAARPLPEAMAIRGSPVGSLSAGQ